MRSLFGPCLLGNMQLILSLSAMFSFLSFRYLVNSNWKWARDCHLLHAFTVTRQVVCSLQFVLKLIFSRDIKKKEKCERLALFDFYFSSMVSWWVNWWRSRSWAKRRRVTSGHRIPQVCCRKAGCTKTLVSFQVGFQSAVHAHVIAELLINHGDQ